MPRQCSAEASCVRGWMRGREACSASGTPTTVENPLRLQDYIVVYVVVVVVVAVVVVLIVVVVVRVRIRVRVHLRRLGAG